MGIKHPTIYMFLNAMDTEAAVLREAERTHPAGGLFYLRDIEEVREVKRRIQLGEGGLNLKRVHVYLVSGTEDIKRAEDVGLRLRDSFQEDFTAVVLTLVVLLNEADLSNLAGNETVYERVFLLSDRNEHDVVSAANRQKIYALIANLPLLQFIPSHFDEIVNAKAREQGRILFMSAGFWQRERAKPEVGVLNAAAVNALYSLAGVLDKSMAAGRDRGTVLLSRLPLSDVASDIAGVAARPLRFWELWGRSVKEAEVMLYGDEASLFFEEQYLRGVIQEEGELFPARYSLSELVARATFLREKRDAIENDIAGLIGEIEAAENKKTPFLMGSVDIAKDLIGECYAKHHELNNLRTDYTRLTAEYSHLESYLDYIRHVIRQLKNLPLPESPKNSPEETPEYLLANAERLAPLAISLLRDDGLVREQHIIHNADGTEPRLIRLIGGFSPEDLTQVMKKNPLAKTSPLDSI